MASSSTSTTVSSVALSSTLMTSKFGVVKGFSITFSSWVPVSQASTKPCQHRASRRPTYLCPRPLVNVRNSRRGLAMFISPLIHIES
ncbi:hypothetical protein FA13DRAFT_1737588, partial [Coprinellus micaceus]